MSSRDIDMTFTVPQAKFIALPVRYPLFTGGVGSGKSTTMTKSAFIDATHSPNATVTIYEPTYQLVKDVAALFMEKFLVEHKFGYKHNKNEHSMTMACPQLGTFEFRSYENPDLLIGYESYRSHVDEIDTLSCDKATLVWNKILARTRQWPIGLPENRMKWNENRKKFEPVNRVSAYSTPEGYKFTYQRWGVNKDQNPQYAYVQAETDSNPFLMEDYANSLRETYAGPLVDAYLKGKWVNMTSGTVYKEFNRKINFSHETIKSHIQDGVSVGETLYIGADFNVTNCSCTIWVKRNGGLQWHAVEELTGIYDTVEMCRIITERWLSKGHTIIMYPDASGKNRNAANGAASAASIAMLRQAHFQVRAKEKNVPVADRVAAMNNGFSTGRCFVNLQHCPTVANCLEQQSFDKNGEPDKNSGVDHQNDATTYPIAYEMPIRKPMFALDFSFVS